MDQSDGGVAASVMFKVLMGVAAVAIFAGILMGVFGTESYHSTSYQDWVNAGRPVAARSAGSDLITFSGGEFAEQERMIAAATAQSPVDLADYIGWVSHAESTYNAAGREDVDAGGVAAWTLVLAGATLALCLMALPKNIGSGDSMSFARVAASA